MENKEKEDKLIAFLKAEIESNRKMTVEFKEGGKLIPFKDIYAVGSNKVTIEKGIDVLSTEKGLTKDGKRYTKLRCWMKKKAVLKAHAHPDYSEGFKTIEGFVIDKIKDIFLEKGMSHSFELNEWHWILAIQDSIIDIMCIEN